MADSTEDKPKSGVMEAEHTQEEANGLQKASDAAENGNKFQQAVAAWRSLDLTKMVSALDTTAEEMVTQQKDSLVQRKELAQKTKAFRKLNDEAKLAEIKELLKAYQDYVDVLTNHNKTISSAFMQAYSPLSEAPDPYPLLEASIDSLVTVDEVVPKLESENTRLQKQVTKLNGQVEDSEKQLEEERAKRLATESSQDSRVKEVEASWTAVLKEKEDNWAAKERSLEEKTENQERLLKELKASYEVSQRLEKSGGEPQEAARSTASAAELDFANSELEKVSMRLADVEARNEQLRLELAQSASQTSNSARSLAVEDSPAFLRLRSENTSLLRRLDSARYDKETERSKLEAKQRGAERELASLKADRDALQSKVQKWNDYEEVKRELDMLRAIEFAAVEDEDDEDSSRDALHANGSASGSNRDNLEQLLAARNKKLSNELTELRVSHQELQRRLEQLQEDLSGTNMDLEQARKLNATLENDLQKTQQEAFNAFETMSVAGTYTSRYPKSSYGSRRGGGGPSPTSSIIGGYDAQGSGGGGSGTGSPGFRGGEPVGGGSGILPMVTAQRDRFKKKLAELEVELQKQYQTVSSLRSEVSTLQKDNLTLYEKSRYVSTYSRGGGGGGSQPATSGAAYGANPNPAAIKIGADAPPGLALDRYRSAYEQNISPFAAFRGRESARALKRMSLPERAVFQVTRMVLATRTSRNLFALYCVALHLLVFVMLYWMGSADIERHASNLGAGSAAAAEAAARGGGQGLGHGDWQPEGLDEDY